MMKHLRNNRGVALMMVLGSVLILSTLVVEFAYNTHVSYELAASERDRLKAYYLARSGYSLVKLELKYEKDMRARYASLLSKLQGSGVTADPLCKQIPLSTGLLKGIQSGELFGAPKEGEEGDKEGKDEEAKDKAAEEKKAASEKAVAAGKDPLADLSTETREFLSFDGDFEVTCDTEERKINLNVFREPLTGGAAAGGTAGTTPSPTTGADVLSLYDSQKELLYSLMTQKEYEDIFKGKTDEARKLVNAIADWADRDDRINEAPGVSGGAEDSLYGGEGVNYKVKNGRYASVAELLLIAGMTDDIYQKLAPQVTVYGDNKINLCQAEEEMVRAFVQRYIQTTPGIAPISPGDEEKWTKIVEGVKFVCTEPSPKPEAVAQAIATAIGAPDAKGLTAQISTTNRFYRIEASAAVGESKMRMISVLDAGSPNPTAWKTLYFRVE